MSQTRMSSKGQVIIPKDIRDEKGWLPGDELDVESLPEGILLKRKPVFDETSLDDVSGCLKRHYKGPARTVDEMNDAIEMAMQTRGGTAKLDRR